MFLSLEKWSYVGQVVGALQNAPLCRICTEDRNAIGMSFCCSKANYCGDTGRQGLHPNLVGYHTALCSACSLLFGRMRTWESWLQGPKVSGLVLSCPGAGWDPGVAAGTQWGQGLALSYLWVGKTLVLVIYKENSKVALGNGVFIVKWAFKMAGTNIYVPKISPHPPLSRRFTKTSQSV